MVNKKFKITNDKPKSVSVCIVCVLEMRQITILCDKGTVNKIQCRKNRNRERLQSKMSICVFSINHMSKHHRQRIPHIKLDFDSIRTDTYEFYGYFFVKNSSLLLHRKGNEWIIDKLHVSRNRQYSLTKNNYQSLSFHVHICSYFMILEREKVVHFFSQLIRTVRIKTKTLNVRKTLN